MWPRSSGSPPFGSFYAGKIPSVCSFMTSKPLDSIRKKKISDCRSKRCRQLCQRSGRYRLFIVVLDAGDRLSGDAASFRQLFLGDVHLFPSLPELASHVFHLPSLCLMLFTLWIIHAFVLNVNSFLRFMSNIFVVYSLTLRGLRCKMYLSLKKAGEQCESF